MRKQIKDKVLDELYSIPIVTIACEKHGISRQTFYRWKDEDEVFRKKVENIMSIGIESINDLAESTLIKNIKSGDVGCTKFWLSNNKYNYIRPREKEFFEKTNIIVPEDHIDNKIEKNTVRFVDFSGREMDLETQKEELAKAARDAEVV